MSVTSFMAFVDSECSAPLSGLHARAARRWGIGAVIEIQSPATPRIMDDLENSLARITMAPYIVKGMALIGVRRRAGSNMFRHQIGTLAILLDYKITDPVLLKASVIHDLFEDAPTMPGVTETEIARIDSDGPAVYALVMEVTIRTVNGIREPKADYLLRIMREGSHRARLLKLADRISNLTSLGYLNDVAFVKRYLAETRSCILPFAADINHNMFTELSDLVDRGERWLPVIASHRNDHH
jgi:(p)ppGpp synthase/HD superfamily hydrolase